MNNSNIIYCQVDTLLLDSENPRLPESFKDRTQENILKYLWDNDSLSELIESYIQNGYFPTEPIIALPADRKTGKRVVVEGNRRLAALLILLETDRYKSAKLEKYTKNEKITQNIINSLESIPVVETPNRDSIISYLGFRHVSGLRQWGAAEKARWIYEQINKNKGDVTKNKNREFYDLGRKIGSNAAGVKNSYCAYALLLHCKDNLNADVQKIDYILRDRFTVWQRIIYNATISKIIDLEISNQYSLEKIESKISSVNKEKILEIISDIFPGKNKSAIVSDSRNIQTYSKVLSDNKALGVLRQTGNLYFAAKIIEDKLDLVHSIIELEEQIENISVLLNNYKESSYTETDESGRTTFGREEIDMIVDQKKTLQRKFRYLIADIDSILDPDTL